MKNLIKVLLLIAGLWGCKKENLISPKIIETNTDKPEISTLPSINTILGKADTVYKDTHNFLATKEKIKGAWCQNFRFLQDAYYITGIKLIFEDDTVLFLNQDSSVFLFKSFYQLKENNTLVIEHYTKGFYTIFEKDSTLKYSKTGIFKYDFLNSTEIYIKDFVPTRCYRSEYCEREKYVETFKKEK